MWSVKTDDCRRRFCWDNRRFTFANVKEKKEEQKKRSCKSIQVCNCALSAGYIVIHHFCASQSRSAGLDEIFVKLPRTKEINERRFGNPDVWAVQNRSRLRWSLNDILFSVFRLRMMKNPRHTKEKFALPNAGWTLWDVATIHTVR